MKLLMSFYIHKAVPPECEIDNISGGTTEPVVHPGICSVGAEREGEVVYYER